MYDQDIVGREDTQTGEENSEKSLSIQLSLSLSEIFNEEMWRMFAYYMCSGHKAHNTEYYP